LSEADFATAADRVACREMIRVGSRSFHTASLLLPKAVREGAYALYGFCRLSDDAVDLEGGEGEAVERLRTRLDRVYAGSPGADAVERTLADTVRRFTVPRALLDALLEGLAWDVEGRIYETVEDLHAYAARVAGSVGAMMAVLMGARTPALVARACDLGAAMQLTNIARDVGEDARLGRLYLPRVWMREAGLDPDAWLAAPAFDARLAGVIDRLLTCADALYERADAGIANLDAAFRPAIFAARHLYAEIGVEVRRRGLDSVTTRASTSAWRKAALVALALRCARRREPVSPAGRALAETRFLVEAVMSEPAPCAWANRPGRHTFETDMAWTLGLFAAMARRDGGRSAIR
jgi:phytoene synthase